MTCGPTSEHLERMALRDGLEDTPPAASDALGTQHYGLLQATQGTFGWLGLGNGEYQL